MLRPPLGRPVRWLKLRISEQQIIDATRLLFILTNYSNLAFEQGEYEFEKLMRESELAGKDYLAQYRSTVLIVLAGAGFEVEE